MSKKVFFVAGTDTGVGKSYVSAGLLEAALQTGKTTAALKPIASGCRETPAGLRNEDAELLQRFCSVPLTYEQINPVALPLAIAPHLAAAEAGRRIDIERLLGFCRAVLLQKADLTIIEGAGGWRVPINERHALSELPRRLQIPVILVVGMRLGCINHALLTAQAIRADGLELAGWVANHLEPDMPFAEENAGTLNATLNAPCLAQLPFQPHFTPDSSCAALLDIRLLLQDPEDSN